MPKKKRRRRKLPNGKGSISEIKKGNRYKPFILRSPAITMPDGTVRRSIIDSFETYEEAYQAAMVGKYEVNNKTTFHDLFMQYKESNKWKNISDNSKLRHEANIKKWDALIYKPINEVSYFELQSQMDIIEENGYLDQNGNAKEYSWDSLNKTKSTLSLIYEQGIKNQLVTVNLARKITIETPNTSKGTKAFPMSFIKHCFNMVDKVPDARKLLVNIYTGLRPIEMRNLKKENINFIKNYISGMGAKTEAGINRKIVIHPKIKRMLFDLYKETDDYIMGKEMTPREFRETFFKPLIKELGFEEDRTPYACRKTLAYLMNHFSVDKEVMKRTMGHESFETTSTYYLEEDLEKSIEEFTKIG